MSIIILMLIGPVLTHLSTFPPLIGYFSPLFPVSLVWTESRPGSGPSDHQLRAGEGHRLLQALHDTGDKYSLPQAQRHQPRGLLLPQPPLTRHLAVYSAGLLGCQLRAVCHCQVTVCIVLVLCRHVEKTMKHESDMKQVHA